MNVNFQLLDYTKLVDKTLYKVVQEICSILTKNGARPYLVGGCVRDALLGKKVFDFDIEVFGVHPEQIISILSPTFEILPQKCFLRKNSEFGVFKVKGSNVDISIPRSEVKIGDNHNDFDVQFLPLNCNIEEAANRRDFTINAIYFDVKRHELCDPYGGILDLRNKILKNIGEKFSEDPLRVLRAMQFISRFELIPTRDLIELSSSLSLCNISAERIFLEWKKLMLLGTKPSLGLQFLKKCGWIKFFPEIDALTYCDQDHRHHPEGNVFTHTCLAIDLFANDRLGIPSEDLTVGFATLCHDFGKPVTTTRDGNGIHHFGHDVAAVPFIDSFLSKMKAPKKLIQEVKLLVQHHMAIRDDHFDKLDEKSRKISLLKLSAKVGRLDRLIRVCIYDHHGRGGVWGDCNAPEYELKSLNLAKSMARQLGILDKMPEPIIKGRDLIKLGLIPSDAFSKILKATFEAQLNMIFYSYDEGMDFVKSLLVSGSKNF